MYGTENNAVLPSTWTEQTSTLATELNSVSAVDDNVAWASGAAGKVVRTTNKGVTWTNVSGDLPITNPGYVIWAIDASNAVVTTSPCSSSRRKNFQDYKRRYKLGSDILSGRRLGRRIIFYECYNRILLWRPCRHQIVNL